MELPRCRNQSDGQVCYGLVNNVSDEQSRLGTKYSVPQIALYKGVMEAIVQDATAQGFISTIDALNIQLENQVHSGTGSQSQGGSSQVPPALRNFSMSQKEKTLDELVHDRWLCLPLMVTLDLVSNPTLICEVGFIILAFHHVKNAMKLQ
ncbi:hypothetical protein GH714_008077 [Hevea brasiliensis]|uniref:Non-structural maintenance of chromosomes element 1 homolog n=1 Tax=Hevea brasiliensis TaxID=3981 RepID=A0A6A6LHR7_HEVBR|nr:hypothetical protein GH714_008077 [Hevea brasiliensis]